MGHSVPKQHGVPEMTRRVHRGAWMALLLAAPLTLAACDDEDEVVDEGGDDAGEVVEGAPEPTGG